MRVKFDLKLNFLLYFSGKRSQQDEVDDGNIHRRSKKVSSICINLPAAGLGQRPPSVHSSTTDEGGFNEPSPEIKALKTVYDFDSNNCPPIPPIPSHPDVLSGVTYVDLAHRAQPEGIESDQVYDENESYRRLEDDIQVSKEKIVYATIKPEVPIIPVQELLYEKENILDIDDDAKIDPIDIDRGYASPQKMLDPTRTCLHEDDRSIDDVLNKKLPPEPPGEYSETETEDEDDLKPPPPKKIPPPIPELNSPLDLQDVEFADASDNDDASERRNGHQEIPDAMTADEAERLLSSR